MSKLGVAGVLSLILPGAGQIYNGEYLRAIFWLIVTPGLWIGSAGLLGWICHLIASHTASRWPPPRCAGITALSRAERFTAVACAQHLPPARGPAREPPTGGSGRTLRGAHTCAQKSWRRSVLGCVSARSCQI